MDQFHRSGSRQGSITARTLALSSRTGRKAFQDQCRPQPFAAGHQAVFDGIEQTRRRIGVSTAQRLKIGVGRIAMPFENRDRIDINCTTFITEDCRTLLFLNDASKQGHIQRMA